MKVIVGISKRHLHITEEVFKEIFGDIELEARNELAQPGQFASKQTVDLKWNDKILEKVRIVGPFRKYNQIEISVDDAKNLGVMPPRRISGDIEGSLPITLVGPLGEITIDKGLILAERHIHFTPEAAEQMNVKNNELVGILKDENLITEAIARIDELSALELHVDSDEALEFNLNSGEEVDIIKCGK